MDLNGRLVRCSETTLSESLTPHTAQKPHAEETALSLAVPSESIRAPVSTCVAVSGASENKTAALSILTGRETEANNKE